MVRQAESLAAWSMASMEMDQVIIALHAHVMRRKQLAVSSPAEHQKRPLETPPLDEYACSISSYGSLLYCRDREHHWLAKFLWTCLHISKGLLLVKLVSQGYDLQKHSAEHDS